MSRPCQYRGLPLILYPVRAFRSCDTIKPNMAVTSLPERHSATEATAALESRAQVERILQSKDFRTSEVLRHLFGYLAEQSLAGTADSLKEYTIGPGCDWENLASFDPRQESVVRMHTVRGCARSLPSITGRKALRIRIVVDMPKGGLWVTFEPRQVIQVLDSASTGSDSDRPAGACLAEPRNRVGRRAGHRNRMCTVFHDPADASGADGWHVLFNDIFLHGRDDVDARASRTMGAAVVFEPAVWWFAYPHLYWCQGAGFRRGSRILRKRLGRCTGVEQTFLSRRSAAGRYHGAIV